MADIAERIRDVRFTLKSGHAQRRRRCQISARSEMLIVCGKDAAGTQPTTHSVEDLSW
jgi:hypothetical protein